VTSQKSNSKFELYNCGLDSDYNLPSPDSLQLFRSGSYIAIVQACIQSLGLHMVNFSNTITVSCCGKFCHSNFDFNVQYA
jgi:hypothetical protein